MSSCAVTVRGAAGLSATGEPIDVDAGLVDTDSEPGGGGDARSSRNGTGGMAIASETPDTIPPGQGSTVGA
jgi:hypothetical protein